MSGKDRIRDGKGTRIDKEGARDATFGLQLTNRIERSAGRRAPDTRLQLIAQPPQGDDQRKDL